MTKLERKAALAVLAAAAAVTVSGVRLAKKRAAYLISLAAARFKDDCPKDGENTEEK